MDTKENAFDLLRLLLATAVLITHGIAIGGYRLDDPLFVFSKGQTNLAEIGIMGFFSLSGYLITASFQRSQNPFVFAGHRLLRIMPAFWVSLLMAAFILGPAIYRAGGGHLAAYFSTHGANALSFVAANFFLKINQWSISGVLDTAVYKESLNGSLWSLFPEMQCYCFTLLAGICGLLKKNSIPFLMIAIALFFFFVLSSVESEKIGPTILVLSPAFKLYTAYMAGSLIYVFSGSLLFGKKESYFMAALGLLLLRFGGFHMFSPILTAVVLINVFRQFAFKAKYDISYGVYIYGFIVEQLLFVLFPHRLPVFIFIGMAAIAAGLLGLASYVIVERPFINLKTKLHQFFR